MEVGENSVDWENPGTLKELTLKTIIFNFDEVFLEEIEHDGVNGKVRPGIYLPTKFFEQILEKSREMRWMIMPQCLKTCLSAVNELNWQNIQIPYVHHPYWCLKTHHLQLLVEQKARPKTLSFTSSRLNAEDFGILSKVGSALECLEIYSIEDCSKRKRGKVIFEKASFPNLHELSLNCKAMSGQNPDFINLDLCSSTLQVLKLEYARIKKPFLNRIKCLTKLKTISFHGSTLVGFKFTQLIEVIEVMENLEKLDLGDMKLQKLIAPDDEEAMGKMMSKLTKLESLEVSRSDIQRSVTKWIPSRRLSYLGVFDAQRPWVGCDLPGELFNADRIACLHLFENALIAAEEFINRIKLFRNGVLVLQGEYNCEVPMDTRKRLESIILDGMERYASVVIEPYDVMYGSGRFITIRALDSLLVYLVKLRCASKDFVGKMLNLLISSCNSTNITLKWDMLSKLSMCNEDNEQNIKNRLTVRLKFLERYIKVSKYTGDMSLQAGVVRIMCSYIQPYYFPLDQREMEAVLIYLRELLKRRECRKVFVRETGCNTVEDFEEVWKKRSEDYMRKL